VNADNLVEAFIVFAHAVTTLLLGIILLSPISYFANTALAPAAVAHIGFLSRKWT
jgi:ABC-type phosphate/phosphonate transport system permease subunit